MTHPGSFAPLPPGSTIGIFGGGQLGRMTACAASRLGYRVHSYSARTDSPAFDVSAQVTVADYDDEDALTRFAQSVDVVTFEFENIPLTALRFVEEFRPLHPSWHVLEVTQDRLLEKEFVNAAGAATTAFAPVESAEDLERAIQHVGTPCVLKTARMGYDGKGQARVARPEDASTAWEKMRRVRCIAEQFVDFERELSVVVARAVDGEVACFDAVENRHVDAVLRTTIAPAPIDPKISQDAADIARRLAEALNLQGLMAVEMFQTRDGALLVNEIAPRPHNSGHWTIDACVTSQFEQFVRAVCGLPLASTRRHSDAVMDNLLGPIGDRWLEIARDPEAKLHLYGKRDDRPGRKMGHITRLKPL